MSFINKLSSIFKRNSNGELGHISTAIDRELKVVSDDITNLRLQYDINTATGRWLDLWGAEFNIPRNPNEDDIHYRDRILKLINTPKNTVPAIIQAMKEALGDVPIKVYEPFNHIFRFNISELDGADIIQDGAYMRHGVIDIQIFGVVPDNLYDIVKDIKSAGIKVYFSAFNEITGEDGVLLRMYTDTDPWVSYTQEMQMEVKLNQVYIHIVNESLLGDDDALISGKQQIWSKKFRENQLWARMARTAPYSKTIHIYEGMEVPLEIMDDYFNSVSYEREKELGTATRRHDIATRSHETEVTVSLLAWYGREIYANSVIPINYFIDKTVRNLYYHPADYFTQFELNSTHQQVWCGSGIPISQVEDLTIEELDKPITFEQYSFSTSVQVETTNI